MLRSVGQHLLLICVCIAIPQAAAQQGAEQPSKSLATLIEARWRADGDAGSLPELLALKDSGTYEVSEAELNALAYACLGQGDLDAATVIFQLNTEAFPDSANAWDSMGEVQLAAGNDAEAIANYARSVELNPRNGAARAIVWRLKRAQSKSSADQNRPVSLNGDRLTQRLDQAVQDVLARHHLVGAAVVVVHAGKTIALRGYGLADRDTQVSVDPKRTVFRIGSISKALTLLTLARLVDRQELERQADVQRYFGTIDNPHSFPRPITIEHLMTHTTGLDQIGIGRQIREWAKPLEERKAMRPSLMAFLQAQNLRRVSPAGAFYRYDTYGTTLAGAIIERTVGKPYAEAMRQEMFQPLGMSRTSVEVQPQHLEDLAVGYERIDDQHRAQPYEVYLTTPASSIDATAADMGRLLEALTSDGANAHGRLFSPEMAREVLQPQYRPHPEFPGVTHGLHEANDASGEFERPIRSVDHGGVMAGFRSLLTIVPQHQLGVFVTTNTSGIGGRNELAVAVMQAVLAELPETATREPFPVPVREPTRDLHAYEGVYSYGVFCHSCSPTEFAQGAWTPGPPTEVRASRGGLLIGDREFIARGGDVFIRDDGRQMAFFGRSDQGEIQFFTYSTSDDAFERVDTLPQ